MCLKAESSFFEDDAVVASFGPPLFIFNEIGYLIHTQLRFRDQIPYAAKNLRQHIISKYDVCEDG